MADKNASASVDAGLEYLEEPRHPGVIKLWTYWLDRRGTRPLPDRADINLIALAPIAPHLVISEAVNGGADFRIRLFGTEVTRITGEDRTGALISELGQTETLRQSRVRERWHETTRAAFERRRPVFVRAEASVKGREHVIYNACALPLTNGDKPEQQLGAMFMDYRIRGA